MSDQSKFDVLQRGYVNLKAEADRVRRMGLLTYSKKYAGKRAKSVGVSGAIMVNTLFVALGVVLIVFESSVFYSVGGGISTLLGVVGLINNVRYAL